MKVKSKVQLLKSEKRTVTPQPQVYKQDQSRLNQSMNTTPLRSNIKKPSTDSKTLTNKKVVIHDPTYHLRVKQLLYNIQQFLIKKIITYQQEGFDLIATPYIKQVQLEQQIVNNHNMRLMRENFQFWLKKFQSQTKSPSPQQSPDMVRSPMQLSTLQQTKLFKNRLSSRETIEFTFNENLKNYCNKYRKIAILKAWKNDLKKFQQDAVFVSKSVQKNLNRFLHDMSVTDVKLVQKQDDALKASILLNKKQLPKREKNLLFKSAFTNKLSNLQASLYKTPVRVSSAVPKQIKSSNSIIKESQHVILPKQTQGVSRILFSESLSPGRYDKEPAATQRERTVEKPIKKNFSAQKLINDANPHKRQPNNITIQKIKPHHNDKSLSDKFSSAKRQPTSYNQQNVSTLVSGLSRLISSRRLELFSAYRIENEQQNNLVATMQLNWKRRIIFNWSQLLPELQVEKFQTKFKLQRLIKAIQLPFFNQIKQCKPKQSRALDRISQFLFSPEKKKKSK